MISFKINEAEEMLMSVIVKYHHITSQNWRKENDINSKKVEDYPLFVKENVHKQYDIL